MSSHILISLSYSDALNILYRPNITVLKHNITKNRYNLTSLHFDSIYGVSLSKSDSYRLSFTGASFLLYESIELAKAYAKKGGWDAAVESILASNVNTQSKSTIKRERNEIALRLKTLSSPLLEKLINVNPDDAKIIVLYAILKTYPFIRDFCLEVLYEKSMILDIHIQEYEINAFFRNQEDRHEAFSKKSDSTKQKLKQVMFKMLSDAGVLKSTKEKIIMKPYMDTSVSRLIADDGGAVYLKALLMSDAEITMLGGK